MVLIASCASHLRVPTPCCDSSSIHFRAPAGWTFLGSSGQRNDAGVFDVGAHGGRYCAVLVTWDTTARGAGLAQAVAADAFRGKRIRLSAWLKENANTNRDNVLWIRVATHLGGSAWTSSALDRVAPSRENAFGLSPWQQRKVVIDVPGDATAIAFGFLIVDGPFEAESGPGPHELFADDFRLEIVGPATPRAGEQSDVIDEFTRRLNFDAAAAAPINLDFEKSSQ